MGKIIFFFLFLLPLNSVFAVEKSTQKIFLVRHAEFDQNSSDRRNPDLSKEGVKRAKNLADILRSQSLKHVIHSEYKRTEQTAKFVLEKNRLSPIILTEPDLIIRKIFDLKGNILIVGHSDTVPQLIQSLGGPSIKIGHLDFSGLYRVLLEEKQFKSFQRDTY